MKMVTKNKTLPLPSYFRFTRFEQSLQIAAIKTYWQFSDRPKIFFTNINMDFEPVWLLYELLDCVSLELILLNWSVWSVFRSKKSIRLYQTQYPFG